MALWELYAGGGLSNSATRQIGANTAARTIEYHQIKRRRLLTDGLNKGFLKPEQLSIGDSALLKADPSGLNGDIRDRIHVDIHPDSKPHGFFGLLGNLGGDIVDVAKNIVPGIYQGAKAFVHDVGTGETILKHGHLNPKSELEKKVVAPTIKSYKNTYGPGGGSFWENFYKHPLGPILDVATVASGGAGAVARAGRAAETAGIGGRVASKAARITSRERPDLNALVGNESVKIPRSYSERPLVKGPQVLFDKIEARTKTIHKLYGASAARRYATKTHSDLQLQVAQAIRGAMRPIEESFGELSPKESIALHLSLRGVNTLDRVKNFQQLMRNSLEGKNPEGFNVSDLAFNQVDKRHVERLAKLDDETIHYALHPTAHMVDAAENWHRDVTAHVQELGIDEATHNEAIIAHQRLLQELQDENGLFGNDEHPLQAHEQHIKGSPELSEPSVPENYPIAPDYVPDRSIEGMQWYEPPTGIIRGNLAKLGRYSEPGLVRRKRDDITEHDVTPENVLAPTGISATHRSTGATFTSGAFRVDSHVFLEHVRSREKILRENVWKRDTLNRLAAKAENSKGEYTIQKFKSPAEMRNTLGPGWTLVAPDFVYSTFRKERNMLEDVQKRSGHLIERGILPDDPEFNASLEELAGQHAENFVRSEMGQIKKPGVAIPSNLFRHIKNLQKASDEFSWGPARLYQRYIRAWRSATLTFMPRWALNTAVGTFLQTLVSGAGMDLRNYTLAYRMRPAARGPVGRGIEKVAEHMGLGKFDPEGWIPEGTFLGRAAVAEDFGELRNYPGMFERIIGARLPTRQILEGVQGIEDYFRSVMLAGALRREGRHDRREADSLEFMGEEVADWYRHNVPDHEYVDWLLKDKDRVDRAMENVNRFGYNYAHLGPMERRYVRQLIPFWGWYRFITKLAWRLPVEYPGRTMALSFLAQAGQDKFDELGQVPDWLRGSIILNFHGGHLKYLSGMGVNPFSQFANPLAPHGAISGLLELGQFSPVIQAGLLAEGLDPLTGDSVRISPQEGVSRDILGRLVDTQTGQQVSPVTHGGLRRAVMGLIRAFPEARIGEKYGIMHGDTPYPESIPGIAERPMGTKYKPQDPEGVLATALASTGMLPKSYDVGSYQDLPQRCSSTREAETSPT
jgi:hypothetical protein